MRHSLQSFAASCHEILESQDNPAGRRQVATLLAELLQDPAFVDAQFDAASPERKILTPGAVHVYNEGDLHSPSRAGPTRLLRIEGVNLEQVQRARYEEVSP